MTRRIAVLALAAACVSPGVNAADPTLKDIKLGEVLYGPAVEADQLQGAVVFVEHWGVH
jgi:hypothetical protein